jgi:hypothetical protein
LGLARSRSDHHAARSMARSVRGSPRVCQPSTLRGGPGRPSYGRRGPAPSLLVSIRPHDRITSCRRRTLSQLQHRSRRCPEGCDREGPREAVCKYQAENNDQGQCACQVRSSVLVSPLRPPAWSTCRDYRVQ